MQRNSELIDAVLRGDHSAFATLVRRYERLVWTICWDVLRDYHATQDVTQDVFLLSHSRMGELRQPDSIGPWISSIARREALRFRKQRSLVHAVQDIEVVSDGDDPAITTQASVDFADGSSSKHEELLDAVAKLPEHERIVIVLRYLNGHSVVEVAELTGRPVGTVTKQLSRAVRRLKSRLASQISDVTDK